MVRQSAKQRHHSFLTLSVGRAQPAGVQAQRAGAHPARREQPRPLPIARSDGGATTLCNAAR
jgi:hypothetical protein